MPARQRNVCFPGDEADMSSRSGRFRKWTHLRHCRSHQLKPDEHARRGMVLGFRE